MPQASSRSEATPKALGPIDAADALLCALVVRGATALTLEPKGRGYEAALLSAASSEPLALFPRAFGYAVAVRLGIIGGLDPWAGGDRLGRIEVSVARKQGDFLVVMRGNSGGFSAELRRLVEHTGATATVKTAGGGPNRLGPYTLECEVGRGAMGIVYRAVRDGLERPVAIKLLAPSIASDPGMAARFVREGRAAAQVNDPGVVGVTDFGTLPDGRAFLVMEFVEGRTLEARLAKDGCLPAQEAVRIAAQIATALEAAHVRGVIHRDLKPSNIFLTDDGGIKIADFGAAHVGDGGRGTLVTQESMILGTPLYMAPEQAQGERIDDRADVYALGCILFCLLAGAPPFRGGAALEILLKHIRETPPPVTSPFGLLPDLLVSCVSRALAKRPDDRFKSAGEMRAVLERVLAVIQAPSTRQV